MAASPVHQVRDEQGEQGQQDPQQGAPHHGQAVVQVADLPATVAMVALVTGSSPGSLDDDGTAGGQHRPRHGRRHAHVSVVFSAPCCWPPPVWLLGTAGRSGKFRALSKGWSAMAGLQCGTCLVGRVRVAWRW